ncbi:EAL domain-containing protein [Amphritea sp. 2_MG-2023]|uniref:putative bifunctional diguanylate cyclase/phosphodiesterase n=1 Tax=Amphritea TaxID=515417 RepID=UPI001C06AA4B|nr:EAL domain-containing protein [Amphritea sp. 2_MG-2023]MBU2967640.1 EAL domain-containing protein [Amphritea atlantica]MDO6420570.1 EAL domain-containing protein [Amphritea sp. 2_MG-2023]
MTIDKVSTPFRVLVVDDDLTARILATHSLEQEGFDVLLADNGLTAIQLFQETQPDIVLMDVEMPGLNGFDVCRQLRSIPYGKLVPILMATGQDDIDSVREAYAAGATDFVSKPFNWKVLGHRLNYMIRASNTNEQLRQLQKSEARLGNAQRIARLGNWEWHISTGEVYWSDQFYHLQGAKLGVTSRSFRSFLRAVPANEWPQLRHWFRELLNCHYSGFMSGINHSICLLGDDIRNMQHQAEVFCDNQGRAQLISGTMLDVSELKQAQDQVLKLARFDSLTGLSNRSVFCERVQLAMDHAARNGSLGAVLFLDLDNFKRINDTFGHGMGDLLLKEVACRLSQSISVTDVDTAFEESVADALRVDDSETTDPDASNAEQSRLLPQVARFGGDEFTVLLPEINQVKDAEQVARRILDTIGRSIDLAGQEVVITPSIGIAVFPHHGENVDSLMKNVDAAMYYVKHAGKNGYELFVKSMNVAAKRRLALESALRHAIEDNELTLNYQPQVDMCSGRIVGVEALLRWNSEQLGLVSPVEFISVAEETGFISAIGEWVMREACRQTRQWQLEGLPHIRVAVNLSVRQFAKQHIDKLVTQVLLDTGLPVDCLELEITENMLMDDVEGSVETLHRLKALGVQLAIDDFGTGYSSLSYLKRFPIDRLKVDRSFITHVTTDSDDAAVTQAIIAVAHNMGLSVTAEGVEDRDQLAFLNELACEEVQGYLFSRPLTPDDLAALLKSGNGYITLAPND